MKYRVCIFDQWYWYLAVDSVSNSGYYMQLYFTKNMAAQNIQQIKQK